MSDVTLVECPRDAFQGLPGLIPTPRKIEHLSNIVRAGIVEIDCGSFVSAKAVPQMADTEAVLVGLRDTGVSLPRLIGIVANERGLERAAACLETVPEARGRMAIGYPLSIAETFQKNNTGRTIAESWPLAESLQQRAVAAGIEMIVYISMGFGNPYGEPWSAALVAQTARRLADMGVRTISLADTVGLAQAALVRETFTAACAAAGPGAAIGAHFHAAPGRWAANVDAALDAGCRRFDTSLGGYGGCPFAQDELVGNIPTEGVIEHLALRGISTGVRIERIGEAAASARQIFEDYGHA